MMIVDRIQLQYGIMYVVMVLEPWRGNQGWSDAPENFLTNPAPVRLGF